MLSARSDLLWVNDSATLTSNFSSHPIQALPRGDMNWQHIILGGAKIRCDIYQINHILLEMIHCNFRFWRSIPTINQIKMQPWISYIDRIHFCQVKRGKYELLHHKIILYFLYQRVGIKKKKERVNNLYSHRIMRSGNYVMTNHIAKLFVGRRMSSMRCKELECIKAAIALLCNAYMCRISHTVNVSLSVE